ncbi:SMI1/KNR4 family protein [Phenylobacterium sp. LjRoot219]|uniref:SMI1/KNR4 family protein n=1 Tax=Phenylobacterium sp. LjRoot219 TaxID=3342283 RepID=UPI003ECD7CA7
MTIEALIKVLPPPVEPFEAFNGPWEPIEAELGVVLPDDYKAFARLYGVGYFIEFLGVDIPRSRNPNRRLEYQARVVCEGLASLEFLDEPPYPFWPTPGGLLPFGGTDNGDDLFWLTRGARGLEGRGLRSRISRRPQAHPARNSPACWAGSSRAIF